MGPEEGFNAQTEKFENLVQAGVIDPTKVVRSALQHAASIASLLLTMEAVITQIPERNMYVAMPGMGAGMYCEARCHETVAAAVERRAGAVALIAIRCADGLIRHVRGSSPIVEITS